MKKINDKIKSILTESQIEEVDKFNKEIDKINKLQNQIEEAKKEASEAENGEEFSYAKAKKESAEIDILFAQKNAANTYMAIGSDLQKTVDRDHYKHLQETNKKSKELKEKIIAMSPDFSKGSHLITELVNIWGPQNNNTINSNYGRSLQENEKEAKEILKNIDRELTKIREID